MSERESIYFRGGGRLKPEGALFEVSLSVELVGGAQGRVVVRVGALGHGRKVRATRWRRVHLHVPFGLAFARDTGLRTGTRHDGREVAMTEAASGRQSAKAPIGLAGGCTNRREPVEANFGEFPFHALR